MRTYVGRGGERDRRGGRESHAGEIFFGVAVVLALLLNL